MKANHPSLPELCTEMRRLHPSDQLVTYDALRSKQNVFADRTIPHNYKKVRSLCGSVCTSARHHASICHVERGHDRRGTPPTGDPHRGEDPTEDPPPEGRATEGTPHRTHTDTQGLYTILLLPIW